MKLNFIHILLSVFVILVSCKSKTNEVAAEGDNDLIEISKAQFQSENMAFGEPTRMPFLESVHFTGTISPSATGIAQISLPVAGLINKIHCSPGMIANKGQTLFEIGGNEFVDIQRDFAESSAKLAQLESNFKIVKDLYADNIGTKKEFILAESSYKSEQAKNTALKIKLEKIGLDISKIENGFFYSSYALKAPIKGYITSINATIGQYVEQHLIVVEIIDYQQLQLKLSIFENEINKLEVGQEIEFYLAGNQSETHKAKLTVVGKSMNPNSKAVECYAEIEDLKNSKPVNNQFAEGKVIVHTESTLALPETALIKAENETYILSLKNENDKSYFFEKIKITTGRRYNGFVELFETPESKKLVVKAVYNIQIE